MNTEEKWAQVTACSILMGTNALCLRLKAQVVKSMVFIFSYVILQHTQWVSMAFISCSGACT